MGPKLRSSLRHAALLLCVSLSSAALVPCRAFASEPPESALDVSALISLEQRAALAEPRERCYLYTELLHDWTEFAGRAMSDGDESALATAIQHADLNADKLKGVLDRNSKRLKNAELLLEHTARRLSDMTRVATMDQHDTMQTVLKHLNSVHDDLLAQLFSH